MELNRKYFSNIYIWQNTLRHFIPTSIDTTFVTAWVSCRMMCSDEIHTAFFIAPHEILRKTFYLPTIYGTQLSILHRKSWWCRCICSILLKWRFRASSYSRHPCKVVPSFYFSSEYLEIIYKGRYFYKRIFTHIHVELFQFFLWTTIVVSTL